MVRIETLNSLPDLRNAKFGRPSPRNGLNLLYWFATECVELDDDDKTVTILCKPSEEEYGFEWFHNNEGLFPQTDLTYYEVGNLHHDQAVNLPDYVRRRYTGLPDDSNIDRIVVGIPNNRRGRLSSVLSSVYVTSHDDQRNFDPRQTYRITPLLLRIISNMEQNEFVREIVPSRRSR